jgi:hypothetical protein
MLMIISECLEKEYLLLHLPLLFSKELKNYRFLSNYFMPVSTNKVCGIVASLFNALFNVAVHAYCAVCACSLFSVVIETEPRGNITAQYNFQLPASHRMVLLIVY